MGGADNICSDKTGTLTNNVMEVVRFYAGKDFKITSTVQTEIAADGVSLVVDENTKKPKKIVRKADFAEMGLTPEVI